MHSRPSLWLTWLTARLNAICCINAKSMGHYTNEMTWQRDMIPQQKQGSLELLTMFRCQDAEFLVLEMLNYWNSWMVVVKIHPVVVFLSFHGSPTTLIMYTYNGRPNHHWSYFCWTLPWKPIYVFTSEENLIAQHLLCPVFKTIMQIIQYENVFLLLLFHFRQSK